MGDDHDRRHPEIRYRSRPGTDEELVRVKLGRLLLGQPADRQPAYLDWPRRFSTASRSPGPTTERISSIAKPARKNSFSIPGA